MSGRLGRRYARALFELAREERNLQGCGEELARAVTAFEEPRLRPVCLSPALPRSTRLRNTQQVIAALGLSKTVGNLIALLAGRDRLALLPDVARWYEVMLDDELGRARVAIRSAAPLGAAQRSEVVELARRLTGRGEVLATTEVEPDLLGGVVLDVGGTVYDGSLRAQLVRLSKEMAERGSRPAAGG
jgi:F-type H+-transporting ATPase subunit delta